MKRQTSVQNGFTLTELLVVMVIVGILASIAVPSYQHFVQKQRAREASIALFTSLSLARSEAIKRGLDVEVLPNDSAHWEQGWRVLVVGFDDPLRTQTAMDGVVINLSFGEPEVTYRRTGRIVKPASGATEPKFQVDVDATTTDKVRCVKVSPSGIPKTVEGACS